MMPSVVRLQNLNSEFVKALLFAAGPESASAGSASKCCWPRPEHCETTCQFAPFAPLTPSLVIRTGAGECTGLEKQLGEVQASEAALTKTKAELEAKLSELEELQAATAATRDELKGEQSKGLVAGVVQQ